MSIPVERSETEDFTPPSLEIMGDDAPVFRLKSPSERCRRRFSQLCGDDGLTSFSMDDFNTEKFKAIDLLWPGEKGTALRLYFVELIEKSKQGIDLSPEELAWIAELEEDIFDNHKALRVMRRKVGEFNEYAPRYAMAVYIAGWRNLDVPFKLDAGVISQDCVEAVARALRDKFRATRDPDGFRPVEENSDDNPTAMGRPYWLNENLPFIELYVAASKRLSLTEDEEKNSPSPSPNSSSPDALTTTADSEPEQSKPSCGRASMDNSDTSSSPEANPASD